MSNFTLICIIVACLAALGVATYMVILKLWKATKAAKKLGEPVKPVDKKDFNPYAGYRLQYKARVVIRFDRPGLGEYVVSFKSSDRNEVIDAARALITRLDSAMANRCAVYRQGDFLIALDKVSFIEFDSNSYISETYVVKS
jgi:hypothetical protein